MYVFFSEFRPSARVRTTENRKLNLTKQTGQVRGPLTASRSDTSTSHYCPSHELETQNGKNSSVCSFGKPAKHLYIKHTHKRSHHVVLSM